MPNALAAETSPYLRQHADNPVDWLPWGPLALERACAEDKPLLVSIGYSACHWCHVMERESFEDERTAALMNESFVCVKVDREERPDVDALYMQAVQSLTGRGGWPLNVFLTPEQLPFYGGTYFPPDPRPGMPAWMQVLQAIAAAWSERREEIRAGGERLRAHLSGGAQLRPSGEQLQQAMLDRAVERLREAYDPRNGGFGGAPKFPQAPVIELLLLRAMSAQPDGSAAPSARAASQTSAPPLSPEAEMALHTLRAMAAGGIHDQLGGGFHRYAVDATWTVPHFEKMLYDNALLARAYLHGWQLSGDPHLAQVCRHTLDWALREMRGPEGGFYSALDADSEGIEGRYYVWTISQLREALGTGASAADPGAADADEAIAWLGATEQGNFADPHQPQPGLNVLTARGNGDGPALDRETHERIRERLLAAREQRVPPGLDDKRITSWNALMTAALAEAGAALSEPRYLQAAVACAEFLQRDMRDRGSAPAGARGRLLRTYNDGRAKIDAYLEDHAFLLEALIVLFETTCEERWFTEATALADTIIARFAVSPGDAVGVGVGGGDTEGSGAGGGDGDGRAGGGFYSTAADAEPLIARRVDLEDTPIPAGQSSAAMGLLRLAQLTGNTTYERHAETVLRVLAPIAPRHPTMFGHALQALHWHLAPARPIACAVPTESPGSGRAPTG